MKLFSSSIDRRRALQLFSTNALAVGASAWWAPGVFAEQLVATPSMTEGPFYPDKLPLDTDNDLLIVNNAITPAVGDITHLSGQVLDRAGNPMRNAFVEIWQVDSTASYIHSRGRNASGNDGNFQGYGRFLTDSTGRYYFRTIKPVEYPGRAPHIHVAVSRNGRRILTTQLLINGHPKNAGDGVFRSVRDPIARETVMVDFKPIPDSKLAELQAQFDIVLGTTAFEGDDGQMRGGVGRPEGNPRRG
jgi:protocatechuate 3,4-dioxygenase, beta subunit